MDMMPQTGYRPQPCYYPPDYDPSLNGISGWLVLVIIGRCISIISGVASIANLGSAHITGDAAIISIIMTLISRIILPVLILILIFCRNKLFRIFIIIEVSIILIINILNNDLTSVIQNIIVGAIWIPYLFVSKRVKNTFVYPNIYPAYEGMYGYNYPSYPQYGAGPSAQAPGGVYTASRIPGPTAGGSYYIKDIQIPGSEQVKCPVCDTVQRSDRSCCYKCGARFIQ